MGMREAWVKSLEGRWQVRSMALYGGIYESFGELVWATYMCVRRWPMRCIVVLPLSCDELMMRRGELELEHTNTS